MPVTVPLSSRRPGTSRRRRVASRAATVTAVVTASLGVLTGAELHGSSDSRETRLEAAPDLLAAAPNTDQFAATEPDRFTAFTPPEAQRPQAVPEPVLWEQHRIATEAARPRTVRPVGGVLTSHFGQRWGAMHAGLDFGDPIGAPIAAVTDGVVVEAGPASGFGLWIRVRQDDGTIGVYGHVDDILAEVGQQVRAGDRIATVGNRGYSTGPHLHYEVHHPAAGPIDPLPWLAARGIDVLRSPA
ncbi:M23 family metallopeptidase [Nocardia bovistercoris]|uniref:M23 family metallopeptidase n=1 Tax=Nocardia bovistercoris TaxID=2785916 RepID=A0A931IG07_9NOCA|nr:M23 family metallopeptidase [Nocardia bovistercoris]MBH0779878.1 M23 family metallopeptidase [Nocardia bovistercoris]